MNAEAKSQDTIICPSCLSGNAANAHFCEGCGTPLDSFATTSPFERTLAEGNALLKATRPSSPKSLAFLWLAYGWMPLAFALLCAGALSSDAPFICGAIAAPLTPFALWAAMILFKAHLNYKRSPEPSASTNCLRCGEPLPDESVRCPKCGWSYEEGK
jgi:predicted amidophosphoribosyltransferase